MDNKEPVHPMQPLVRDCDGVIRFHQNAIVRYLQEWASKHGCDLNDLALIPFSEGDWQQFMQLIGYSVNGYCELSRVGEESKRAAEKASEGLQASDGSDKQLELRRVVATILDVPLDKVVSVG